MPQANSKFYSLCVSAMASISPVVIVKQVCGLAEVSGLNGDDTDPKLCHFLPHGAAETFKGVLGSAVDRQSWVAVKPSHTAHVYNTA